MNLTAGARHLAKPYDESDGLSHILGPQIARGDAHRLKARPPRHRTEQTRVDAGMSSTTYSEETP